MFLRRCVRRKNGKPHTYWALVESYRTARGSRQRLVAYLGELQRTEQSGWAQLGRKLSGKRQPQRSLFDPPHYDDPADEEEPVLVRLKGVALDRLRDFGDVWLAYGLWRLLELDHVLVPTVSKNGQPNKTIRLRCVTEPDAGQKVLLHRLGIQLPRRLRRLDEVV
jgi:hypothetical protein